MVLVIAHRGASGYYPENTLKSIEYAIEMDSDIVEIDLKMTKDRQIVLMHDDAVDRGVLRYESGSWVIYQYVFDEV